MSVAKARSRVAVATKKHKSKPDDGSSLVLQEARRARAVFQCRRPCSRTTCWIPYERRRRACLGRRGGCQRTAARGRVPVVLVQAGGGLGGGGLLAFARYSRARSFGVLRRDGSVHDAGLLSWRAARAVPRLERQITASDGASRPSFEVPD